MVGVRGGGGLLQCIPPTPVPPLFYNIYTSIMYIYKSKIFIYMYIKKQGEGGRRNACITPPTTPQSNPPSVISEKNVCYGGIALY